MRFGYGPSFAPIGSIIWVLLISRGNFEKPWHIQSRWLKCIDMLLARPVAYRLVYQQQRKFKF